MSAATEHRAWLHLAATDYIPGRDLTWDIGQLGSGWTLTVPRDCRFQSSIPRVLRWLVSPHHEPWLLAAAVHDYLLAEGFDRAFAAGEWRRAARACARRDSKRWLVSPAYFAIAAWTLRR